MTQLKLTIKKVFIVIVSILFTFSIVNGQDRAAQIKEASNEVSVQSPDGSIYFKIFTSNGILNYSVTLLRNPVIEQSPMKMMVDLVNLGEDIGFNKINRYQIDEQYPTRGIHSMAINKCNGISINIKNTKTPGTFFLEARAYNNGISFRFIIPGNNCSRVPDEATVFMVPTGSTVWYHDLYSHYEGVYVKKDILEIVAGEWAAPPVTFKLPNNNGFASITEAALIGYSGMALQAVGQRGLIIRLGHDEPDGYPFAVDYKMEDAKRLAIPAIIKDTITTPWRVVMIGKDLNTLVNCDIISNLSPKPDKTLFPDGINTAWIKPGRAVWTWLDGGDRTPEGMKEYSRMAGELGFEYNVVDAFWYRWTDEQISDLVSYSKERGVGVWLWRHGRDVKDSVKRREFFKRCHDLGIVGVKLDAFSNESKEFIDLYQACLREAAEYKLMLNIHGSNKPAGESRMWPNEMTREGIRGLEYGSSMATWSELNTTLPFTRFLAGHGDYTPLIFGDRRKETSWAHQIATVAAFTSPVMILGANPKSILENTAVDMIKSIPSVWDETIALPCSEIGEIVAFARRKGDTWFLTVLNGPTERTLQIPLSFLEKGSWYNALIVCDRLLDPAAVKREKAYTRNTDSLPIKMRAGGGYIARFTK